MTPKEKAKEIIGKMCGSNCTEKNIMKMIYPALIAVDLKIEGLPSINDTPPVKRLENKLYVQYWYSVKCELEKYK